MTLTLVAVYAPLAFTPGRTGRLFVEFALTLAGAVMVSGFVALTLTPMMCSKLLRHNPKPEPLRPRHGDAAAWPTTRGYAERCCAGALRQRWIVLLRDARPPAAAAPGCTRPGARANCRRSKTAA